MRVSFPIRRWRSYRWRLELRRGARARCSRQRRKRRDVVVMRFQDGSCVVCFERIDVVAEVRENVGHHAIRFREHDGRARAYCGTPDLPQRRLSVLYRNVCKSARMTGRAASRLGPGAGDGLEEAVAAALVASRALVGVAVRSLAAIEDTITLVQYRALVLLASQKVVNVGSLAEALGIHASTATRLCDRLAEKNLIDRKTSAASRREVVVALSAEGRALVRSVTARRRREITRIVGRLDPPTRAALVAAFGAFADAAGESPDSAWKLGWTS